MKKRTSIFLVDEQRIVRAGLLHVLAEREDFQVVGEADSFEDALQGIASTAPSVVITEVQSPGLDGLELIRRIRARRRDLRVLVFSSQERRSSATEAMRAGASGYLGKSASPDEVRAAVDAVCAGGVYLAPSVARPVVEAAAPGEEGWTPHAVLSRRQREILKLVAEGLSTREIGERLGLTLRTVESHRYALMKKLNMNRVAHLVRYAIRENLVAP